MNKHYLPAIASLLIIAIALSSFMPVFAALPTRLVAQPTLRVTTIAEDDELRQTGVMWMATSHVSCRYSGTVQLRPSKTCWLSSRFLSHTTAFQ